MPVQVVPANFSSPAHRWAIVDLLATYADTPAGGRTAMTEEARNSVVGLLESHPTALVLLAMEGDAPIGLAVCFEGFSTFKAKPLINVHDLVVSPTHRGKKVGQRLLEAVEHEARHRGCCALTLEVLGDNDPAMRLYRKQGFDGGQAITPADAPMFWKKPLE